MSDITKQDALRWLDMQRDAVNTEIVYAAPDEKKQYHRNLKIVNWLAEAARVYSGEMTAVEYLEARQEMCDSYRKVAFDPCDGCPFDKADPPCGCMENEHLRRAVEIVKRWKEEQDAGEYRRKA